MTKHTMELVWHSCTDCPPEEDFNRCLYVTDGCHIFKAYWERNGDLQRFQDADEPPWPDSWHIDVGVDSDGWWWADLHQTTQGFFKTSLDKEGVDGRLE